MRHVRSLVPYAALSVALVIASAVALASTVGEAPSAGAPLPTGHPVGLSDAGRLAYWRQGPQHALELWVGDLDGRRKWTIASADDRADVALTRWSPEGTSIAYTAGGRALGVAHVDGSPAATIGLPTNLSDGVWKIVSLEWSPDSTRIAATIRAGNGLGNDSDVYVVDAKAGARWRRVTSIGDAFAEPWIDQARMLIETSSGMIATVDVGIGDVRPITGMPAASPIVGRDGRVYFVAGRSVSTNVFPRPYGSGWVWSATIDGDDVRRESAVELDQVRLYGMLADGRAAAGGPAATFLVGKTRVVLAFRAGWPRSLEISADGRGLVASTGSRVLLIDPPKVPDAGETLLPDGAASVLIDGVTDANVWYPRVAPTLAHAPPRPSTGPQARLAYVLGRQAWETDPNGKTRVIATGDQQFFVSSPRWSPSGDRLAVVVNDTSPTGRYSAPSVVIDA